MGHEGLDKKLADFTRKLGKDSPKTRTVAKRLDDEKAKPDDILESYIFLADEDSEYLFEFTAIP